MHLSLSELATCPVVHEMLIEAHTRKPHGGFNSSSGFKSIVGRYSLKSQDICGPDGSLYMTRYTAMDRPDGRHIYFNCFHRPDGDNLPHDHPWDSDAMPLNDGYMEEAVSDDGVPTLVEIRQFHVNHIPATKWHRIKRLMLHGSQQEMFKGAPRCVWTIQSTGPYKQSWGFREWSTGRKVYHKGFQTWQKTLHELRTLGAHDIVTQATTQADIEAEIKLALRLMEGRDNMMPLRSQAREALRTLALPVRTQGVA